MCRGDQCQSPLRSEGRARSGEPGEGGEDEDGAGVGDADRESEHAVGRMYSSSAAGEHSKSVNQIGRLSHCGFRALCAWTLMGTKAGKTERGKSGDKLDQYCKGADEGGSVTPHAISAAQLRRRAALSEMQRRREKRKARGERGSGRRKESEGKEKGRNGKAFVLSSLSSSHLSSSYLSSYLSLSLSLLISPFGSSLLCPTVFPGAVAAISSLFTRGSKRCDSLVRPLVLCSFSVTPVSEKTHQRRRWRTVQEQPSAGRGILGSGGSAALSAGAEVAHRVTEALVHTISGSSRSRFRCV